MASLCESLLNLGANPNAQTYPVSSNGDQNPFGDEEEGSSVSKQTPLHMAIQQRHNDIVRVFLDFKSQFAACFFHSVYVYYIGSAAVKNGNSLLIIPNFTLKDSEEQTVFGLALWQVSLRCSVYQCLYQML
jgi:hypothetical protein